MRANGIARAIVRSPKGAAAVRAVADVLREAGKVDGLQIDTLCSATYGAPFAYDRWAEAWPPTAEQIRDGFLPVREREVAA